MQFILQYLWIFHAFSVALNTQMLTRTYTVRETEKLSAKQAQQRHRNTYSTSVVRKVGGTAPWEAVGLLRWALIGTRGGRERCYYHRGALVDK
jgi:hypothetical protein